MQASSNNTETLIPRAKQNRQISNTQKLTWAVLGVIYTGALSNS
ncbi:MAG: hypothetical protein K0S29_1159 [Gammaproteobacteria bacterium]|jgi:hypothetical protein|nr:hypothetical protein [Gammaproteobacteria bacterium]